MTARRSTISAHQEHCNLETAQSNEYNGKEKLSHIHDSDIP